MEPGISLKQRVWNLVEAGKSPDDDAGTEFDWFDWVIAGLIILNVAAFVLETEPTLRVTYRETFHRFEIFSLVVFSIEYLLRLYSCTVVPEYAHPVFGRVKFALRPLQLVDLVAILPGLLFFLPNHLDLRFVRALRLLRILRVLKLGRYSDAVGSLFRVLRKRRPELLVMGLMLIILLIVSASALHIVEEDAQPDKFGTIMQSMWWAVVTLTTIGYGDVVPITPLGRLIGGFIAIAGIGIVALPTAIIASGYSEEIHRARQERRRKRSMKEPHHNSLTCPHCGKAIELHKGE